MSQLPEKFVERIKQIVPENKYKEILSSFRVKESFCVRINSLKTSVNEVIRVLQDNSIDHELIPGFELALSIPSRRRQTLHESGLIDEGKVYIQNLSSQLVPRLLAPYAGDEVLDMCAAPGSKTSQIAAQMDNAGRIVAIERIQGRFHKLRTVLDQLGVENTQVKCLDARRYRPRGLLFDKILIDAPCSSEGRFDIHNPKTTQYWSLRKIREMKRKQKGLLHRGCQLLKKGGTLVYSTCTFAPEENETVVDWVLRKQDGSVRLEPLERKNVPTYPVVMRWRNKEFDPQINNCLRIFPEGLWDAFFVAKIRKIL